MHVYEKYLAVTEKCLKQKKSIDAYKAMVSKLEKTVKELEHQSLSREEEMKKLKEESVKDKAELVEEKSTVASLTEQVTSLAVEATYKARVELFKEYMAGTHVNWNKEEMEVEIAEYEEMLRINALLNAAAPPQEANKEVSEEEEVDKSPGHVEDTANERNRD